MLAAGARALCHRVPMLGALRDSSGRPNLAIRALALLVALLLATPLTLWLYGVLGDVVDWAY